MLSLEEIQSSNNELYIFLINNPTDYHGDLTLLLQKKYRLHNLQEGWVENLSLPVIATALNKVTHVDFLICHFPEIIAQHGKDMIIAASRTGHLEILQKLINLGEEFTLYSQASCPFNACISAAQQGHLHVINYLLTIFEKNFTEGYCRAYRDAFDNDHTHIAQKLLIIPQILVYADQAHANELHFVQFINQQIELFRARYNLNHSFEMTPNEIFICFYILKHLIRHHLPLEFFLKLITDRDLAHLSICNNQSTNELLCLAITQRNIIAEKILFSISMVGDLFETCNYYGHLESGQRYQDYKSFLQSRLACVCLLQAYKNGDHNFPLSIIDTIFTFILPKSYTSQHLITTSQNLFMRTNYNYESQRSAYESKSQFI